MPSARASVAAVAVVALLVGLCAAHPEGSSGPHRCWARQFQCSDGRQCVSLSKRCNDLSDCADGSDEAGCNATTIDLPLYAAKQVEVSLTKSDTGILLQAGSAQDGPRWYRRERDEVGLLGQEPNGALRYLEQCGEESCGEDGARDFYDFVGDSVPLLVEHRPGILVLRPLILGAEAREIPIDGAFEKLRIASLMSTTSMTARVLDAGAGGVVIPANATVTARLPITETRESTNYFGKMMDNNAIEVTVLGRKHTRRIGKVELNGVRSDGTLRYSSFANCSETTGKCTLVKDHTEGSGAFPLGELVLKVKSQAGELAVWREGRPDDVAVLPVEAADGILYVFSHNTHQTFRQTNYIVDPVCVTPDGCDGEDEAND